MLSSKNIISEEVINNAINEELGIANEVTKLAGIIEKKLFSFIKQGFIDFVFEVKTENSQLSVDYSLRRFNNEKEALEWTDFGRGGDGYSYGANTMFLSLAVINNKFDYNRLTDTIHHECSHYWEMKNMGKDLYTEYYQEIINGTRSRNKYINLMSYVVYYSSKNEINSFVNGSYSSAMKKKKIYRNYKEFIEDNSVIEPYEEFKTAIKEMSKVNVDTDTMLELAAMKLGCDKNYLVEFIYDTAEYGLKYLLQRIGKAYSLYMKQMQYK